MKMKKCILMLVTLMVALLAATAAWAVPCNQCGQFATPADYRACMASCTKDAPPPPVDAGTKVKVPPLPVDAGPVCKINEFFMTTDGCICTVGFGRLVENGPCTAICKDGEVRSSDGKCAVPPPPPVCKEDQGIGSWWWLLLVLLVLSATGNVAFALRKKDRP